LGKEDEEDEEDDDPANKRPKNDGADDNTTKAAKHHAQASTSKNNNIEDKEPPLDYVDYSEEEDILTKQEQFERKYNFRFEEPDPEFIKSYPRTVADTMRRKDTKRKEKRDEYKKRKEEEKQRKREEIKRLKNLKRKEILNKIEKIKQVTGNSNLGLNVDDLEKDFDPNEYEKRMQEIFNEDYYQAKDDAIEELDEDGNLFSRTTWTTKT